jgi:hypothetical protein
MIEKESIPVFPEKIRESQIKPFSFLFLTASFPLNLAMMTGSSLNTVRISPLKRFISYLPSVTENTADSGD